MSDARDRLDDALPQRIGKVEGMQRMRDKLAEGTIERAAYEQRPSGRTTQVPCATIVSKNGYESEDRVAH